MILKFDFLCKLAVRLQTSEASKNQFCSGFVPIWCYFGSFGVTLDKLFDVFIEWIFWQNFWRLTRFLMSFFTNSCDKFRPGFFFYKIFLQIFWQPFAVWWSWFIECLLIWFTLKCKWWVKKHFQTAVNDCRLILLYTK